MNCTFLYPPQFVKAPGLPRGQGAAQHLGLAYLSSWLKKHGHTTTVINAFNLGLQTVQLSPYKGQNLHTIGLTTDEIVSRIPHTTELLGVGIPFSNAFPIVCSVVRRIKERMPHLTVVAGGIHASLFPEQCLQEGIDYVISGEGESPMLQLAEGKEPSTIPGLSYVRDTELVHNSPEQGIHNLDEIPFPDYTSQDLNLFFSHPPRGGEAHASMSLVTSRGCPYSCHFCSIHPIYGKKWRARSPENVLDEIDHWRRHFGVRHFEFEDDNLTLERERAATIFEGILSWGEEITWAALNGVRVDTLDRELLSLMRRSGCVQVNLAIESGSETVLSLMNKRLSLSKVEEVAAYCGELGIKAAGFLLIGYPGETERTFRETVQFFKKLRKRGLHAVIPLIVNAYPGTQVHAQCCEKGWLAPDTDEHIFCENDEFVSIITPHADASTVCTWKREAELLINGRMRYFKALLRDLLG